MSPPKKSTVVTAADACRVPVFAPTRRAGGPIEREVGSDSWGSATITGNLDQRHHDVLDAVLHVARASCVHDTGDITVRVDSAELRRSLGWERWRYEHILGCLLDLVSARVSLRSANLTEWSGLVMRVSESGEAAPERRGSRRALAQAAEPDPRRDGSSCRGGLVWEIMISRAWIELLRHLKCYYPPEVWQLRHGVSQALVRMMLSHRSPVMRIDTVLRAIGVGRNLHRAARALVDDGDALSRIGIVIADGWVSRRARAVPEPARPVPEPARPIPEFARPVPESIDI